MRKNSFFRILTLLVLILPVYLTFFANKNQVNSVPNTNLKDQLSSAQLSFFARLASYNGSIIELNNSGAPSMSTANLFTGDTLSIANVGVTTKDNYIVGDIGDDSTIELTSNIGTTTPNAYIIATRSAIHTVSFIPKNTSTGEKWQFLIKASTQDSETYNDGIPDQNGFDLGSGSSPGIGTRLTSADITCPKSLGAGTTTVTIGTTAITTNISTGFTGTYHYVECAYSIGISSPGVGATVTMIIGRSLASGSQLINPSTGINHTYGRSDNANDIFNYGIRQLDNSGSLIDLTFGKLAITESVRVTATVDPTLTFTISNIGSTNNGTVRCGTANGAGAINTTATAVSFGSLGLGSANNLSQTIECATNSQNGYVVQTFENKPLTMITTGTTLPNTAANNGAWGALSNSGFGYSMEVGTTTNATASLGIGTTSNYKAFGVGYASAATVLSNSKPSVDSAYMCYRITASISQPAGTYENSINYIATATF